MNIPQKFRETIEKAAQKNFLGGFDLAEKEGFEPSGKPAITVEK